jgi:hypothetical protein
MDLDDTAETGFIKVTLTFRFRGTGDYKYVQPYNYVFYVPETIP